MLSLIGRWFAPVITSQDYRRSDYLFLWFVLAVGAFLRLWGLGNVGLHGDEETMAIPAMAILETGQPILPSGMYYARALLNIYLMSGSVSIFGETEWAFRLPSAVVGSFTGLAAFFMGRRFLPPQINLAFVTAIVLLPAMIEISQTARMYVFFVTCMIWFAACLFRWERDQKLSSLILTLLVWLLCLHFHRLAIFAAPLFLFPGLSRQSWSQLMNGAGAFLFGAGIFFWYQNWIEAKYPQSSDRPPPLETEASQSVLEVLTTANSWVFSASVMAAVVLSTVIALMVLKRSGWPNVMPVALVGCGVLAMTLLHYHIGAILLTFGVVFWLRTPDLPRFWLILVLSLAALITVLHVGILYQSGEYPGRKIIGALIGVPSIWPVLRFLQYSPIAGLIYGAFFAYLLMVFASSRRIPVHFLFFVLAVWAPLLVLGYFAWNMPPRYAQGQLGYFLLCVFSTIAYFIATKKWLTDRERLSVPAVVVTAIAALVVINPFALSETINSGYESHPDHKGAAEYIRSLNLGDGAILIAEDVLQQAYYLGEIEYSLRPIDDAMLFSIVRDDKLVDQYTGAVVLGTGQELEALLAASRGRELYIIGSGENFVGEKRMLRGHGIAEALSSPLLEVVYEGRDEKTKIWKLKP